MTAAHIAKLGSYSDCRAPSSYRFCRIVEDDEEVDKEDDEDTQSFYCSSDESSSADMEESESGMCFPCDDQHASLPLTRYNRKAIDAMAARSQGQQHSCVGECLAGIAKLMSRSRF